MFFAAGVLRKKVFIAVIFHRYSAIILSRSELVLNANMCFYIYAISFTLSLYWTCSFLTKFFILNMTVEKQSPLKMITRL